VSLAPCSRSATSLIKAASASQTVRALPERLRDLRVFHSKSIVYGAFIWARWPLSDPKPAVSGPGSGAAGQRVQLPLEVPALVLAPLHGGERAPAGARQ
jgi:hypothetical protein